MSEALKFILLSNQKILNDLNDFFVLIYEAGLTPSMTGIDKRGKSVGWDTNIITKTAKDIFRKTIQNVYLKNLEKPRKEIVEIFIQQYPNFSAVYAKSSMIMYANEVLQDALWQFKSTLYGFVLEKHKEGFSAPEIVGLIQAHFGKKYTVANIKLWIQFPERFKQFKKAPELLRDQKEFNLR
jgi:hypothetical protein